MTRWPGASRLLSLLVLAAATLASSCAGPRELTYHRVRSDRMSGARLSYSVWLPPDFREDERLPLITFLHGGGDSPNAFDKHGLSQQFREATARGELPRAVIFFPQGDNGFWANWYDGSRMYQDWILEELIPEVQRRYNEHLQERLAKTNWNSGCKSWYLTEDGFNATMYPGFATQYANELRTLHLADYRTVPFERAAARTQPRV